MKKKPYIAIISVLLAVLLGAIIAINCVCVYWDLALTSYLGSVGEGVSSSSSDGGETDTEYFKSSYSSDAALVAAQQEFAVQLTGEATVLLKNDDALPLTSGAKVSVFGVGAIGGVVSGSGSGAVETTDSHTWLSSLEDAGFEVNATLANFYANSGYSHGTGTSAGSGNETGDWSVNEIPQSEYTSDVKASFSSYSDAAIVVITRSGGEGGDLATEMSRHGGTADRHYLELSPEEEDMLKAIKSAGFKKTIVVINSANAMELGFVDQSEYGVDACLWMAGTGECGIDAFGQILTGEINPSGHLVDTYVYDNFSSPAMQNFGDFRYVDSTGSLTGYSYVNYSEGIYVGYKYYETRYEDVVMGTENVGTYDYASTVKYPFGYGLSYTTFEYSDFSCEVEGETVTLTVTVTNTGGVSGKDAVEFYYQSPYTDYDKTNGIEKSSVELIDFAKTDELAAGGSQIVSVSFELEDITSYDSTAAKTYILDAGTYYFTAASDAHEAVNNILGAKNYVVEDGMTANGDASLVGSYEVSALKEYSTATTGNEITNRFDDCDVDGYTYLTRSNWEMMDNNGLRYATGSVTGVSSVTDAAGTAYTVEASDSLTANLAAASAENSGNPISSTDYPDTSSYTYGVWSGLELVDMMGLDYDDPQWDTFLNQLKLSEMHEMFGKGGYGTIAIGTDGDGINKPKTYEYDGPAGISNYISGASSFSYPATIMLAASWSKDLASTYGSLMGEDALKTKTSGWYAPAVNIHRTPFSGRNYEYYSEDAVLTGIIASEEIKAVQEKGVYVYLKHFALNDQETNRNANGAVATWANEQTIRETYLKAFRYGVERGGAKGIMVSMNRIGYRRAYGNYALITSVLRNEWGFTGIVVTDYTNALTGGGADQALAAGTDLILCTAQSKLTDAKQDWSRAELRRSAHNILYTQANSLAMNGFEHGTTYSTGFPVYMIILIAADVVAALVAAWAVFCIVRAARKTEEQFAARKKWSKRTWIIIYSVIGVVVIAAVIVFFTVLFPIISSALLV